MSKLIPVASYLLLLAFVQTEVSAADQGLTPVPPALVTAPVVDARIREAEANPDLQCEARTKLIALYRKALSNLEEVETDRARADAFEDTTRTAPKQTQRLRERIAADKQANAPQPLGVGLDASLDQIESQLKQTQADRAAADARRAELERQLAYQQNRPAAIRQRLTAAREEQEVIAAALQTELAGDLSSAPASAPGSALVQSKRWSLETSDIALSTEMRALDQELIGLPMRLDLIAASRDAESTDNARIEQRDEGLRALVNARREAEARQAKAEAERMVEAAARLDPALARLAGQNAAFIAEINAIAAQGDRLDAEQQQAERLAARTQASFERMQTAKAVGMPTEGLGSLLIEQRAALPDFDLYAHRARALDQQIAAVNLSRLRHQEEREQLADRSTAGRGAAGAQPAAGTRVGDAAAPDVGDQLAKQGQDLHDKLLEAEGKHLERLRELRATEARVLEAARAYDAFLREQLFWLPTGPKSRLADLAKLPEEVRALLSADRRSALAPALRGEVVASPVLWPSLLLSVVLLWWRRALIAAIQDTAVPLANPSTDRFRYTLKALLLTLAFAAPLPLVLGVTGWHLLDAAQGSGLSPALGGYLVRTALLYALLALRAICLPGGLAIRHFCWAEPDVRRFDGEVRWLTWTAVPTFFVLYSAMALIPVTAGGPVARIGGLIAASAMGLFFYRLLQPKHGVLRRQRQRADAGLLHRAYWLWFPLLLAFPLLLVALAWSGYIYTTHILADAFLTTLGLIAALMLLHALAVRWLSLTRRRLALRAASQRRQAALAAREQRPSQGAETPDLTPDDAADLDLETASEDSLELLGSATAFVAAVGLYLIWSALFPALGIPRR